MGLIKQINDAIKQAMKDRDKETLQALKNLKADLQNYEIANKGNKMDYLSIIQKFVKQRKESAEIYKDANDINRYNEEMKEASIAMQFLPEQISETELAGLISQRVSENNFTSIRDMGKLMKILKTELNGTADMKLLGKLCKDVLTK